MAEGDRARDAEQEMQELYLQQPELLTSEGLDRYFQRLVFDTLGTSLVENTVLTLAEDLGKLKVFTRELREGGRGGGGGERWRQRGREGGRKGNYHMHACGGRW